MSFTIKAVDEFGGVTVSFDVDNVEQHISGLPVGNRRDLVAALEQYEAAYARGLRETAPPSVHPDVRAMIGR